MFFFTFLVHHLRVFETSKVTIISPLQADRSNHRCENFAEKYQIHSVETLFQADINGYPFFSIRKYESQGNYGEIWRENGKPLHFGRPGQPHVACSSLGAPPKNKSARICLKLTRCQGQFTWVLRSQFC